MNENEKENNWRCGQSTHSFRIDLWLSGADRSHEEDARVASDTANIQTGHFLITNVPISAYFSIALFFNTFICHKSNKFLQADGGLSLHATFSCSVADVICGRVTWLLANLTAVCYKTANFSVINTDSSQLWYSASSCYVLCKCVIIKCVI